MAAGRRANDGLATVLLYLIFFLVLTPTSLLWRWSRRGSPENDTAEDTYRIRTNHCAPTDLRRQY